MKKIKTKNSVRKHGAAYKQLKKALKESEEKFCSLKEQMLQENNEALERIVEERTSRMLFLQQETDRNKHLADLGTLAAIVAHELRNPLAGIQIAAYNLKRKNKDPDMQRSIETIELKVKESAQIIEDLLIYARRKPPQYDNVELFALLNETAGDVELQSKKHITVTKNFNGLKEIPLEADPVQLRELFVNIMNNAYDAVGDKVGTIEIAAHSENAHVTVHFKDNGCGIEKDFLDKVWEPFFTTKSNGTGLGLSISRQIALLHSGTIKIESEKEKGTVVTVTLPLKRLYGAKKDDK